MFPMMPNESIPTPAVYSNEEEEARFARFVPVPSELHGSASGRKPAVAEPRLAGMYQAVRTAQKGLRPRLHYLRATSRGPGRSFGRKALKVVRGLSVGTC